MSTELHTYHRQIPSDSNDSLSLLGSQIHAYATILDLGMGTGALGRHLKSLHCTIDGVTNNAAEAAAAKPDYRQAVVADLDSFDITTLFAAQAYDYIVCADVLEHLKAPQSLLAKVRGLLKPGGKLLTSVPNAGYCGLIAELIAGEFRYRSEGLLDETHVRFYTRKSLDRFLKANHWRSVSTFTVRKPLPASEFKLPFDTLPPAVARHLLALPDALSYQFVFVLEPEDIGIATRLPDPSSANAHSADDASPAQALFSASAYLAVDGHYSESMKAVAYGVVGETAQVIRIPIPATGERYTKIRLDPADRAGFLRLYFLRMVLNDGRNVWTWQSEDSDGGSVLQSTQQIFPIQPSGGPVGILLLLLGDDPWIELPLSADALTDISAQGAHLEVGIGWPMSADYLEASRAVKEMMIPNSVYAELHDTSVRLQSKVDDLTEDYIASQQLSQSLMGELRECQNSATDLKKQLIIAEQSLHDLQGTYLLTKRWPFVKSTAQHMQVARARLLSQMDQMKSHNASAQPLPTTPVDIVVPVYRGLADTKRCIESVLRSVNKTPWRLIVINDHCPEPELAEWLSTIVQSLSNIILLENPINMGFVATVNRGMSLHEESDVVLLNSDTEVANDWLDRLQRAAYCRPRISSVTPFSNNATICSYPRFCQNNEIPEGYDTASLDELFARTLAGQTVEIPTAVGFCMYIRRECLSQIGMFDVNSFGKGYGEENDFCMRAIHAGWANLQALDTFVLHAGGVSFGDSKSSREALAMETMRRLHPSYERLVHDFVRQDPAGLARLDIDIARIADNDRPVVLNVSHNREGGTLKHIRELTAELGPKATFLYLTPIDGGAQLTFEALQDAFSLRFSIPNDTPQLIRILKLLRVGHVHFHHLLGHKDDIASLPTLLGTSHDFTVHDYYSYCPQITLTDHTDRYCGDQGIEQCRQCVKRNPIPGGEEIDSWRARHSHLLNRARYVITPSEDVAFRMHRFVPAARVRVASHSTIDKLLVAHPRPEPGPFMPDVRLKVVVLGALSKIKGADILEEVASLAARHDKPIDFHLVGYAYRKLLTQPKAHLTVHGSYDESDLPSLLHWLQPDLIWFPALCPETYSYTLSSALESGYPVVAPDIGAFSERLRGRPWTWLRSWNVPPTQWLDFFTEIREENFIARQEPERAAGNSVAADFPILDYRTEYLSQLPPPKTLTVEQWQELHTLISQKVQNTNLLANHQLRVKSQTLRFLVILRSSSILSPVAKLLPTSFQRRVKSWLVG